MRGAKSHLGEIICLHSAEIENGQCQFCGKSQPWEAMEPCAGEALAGLKEFLQALDHFESEVARQALTDFGSRSSALIAARAMVVRLFRETPQPWVQDGAA